LSENPDVLTAIRERVMNELQLGKQVHRSDAYDVEEAGAGDGSDDPSEDAALEA
jgi:hypothetical protein